MLLVSKYITEDGFVKNLFYKISHNITNDLQLETFKYNVLKPMNDSILIVRGISDFGLLETTPGKLSTKQYTLDIKSKNFSYMSLPEPAFGSALECVATNLSIMTQIECQKVQSYFEPIRIKLVPVDVSQDSIILLLNEVRSNGIHTHKYQLKFEFDAHWSSTCDTCITGMTYLTSELNKLTDELYAPRDVFKLDGRIIYDLSVNKIDVLKDEIKLLLTNALNNARVRDFTITDISDTLKELENEK